MPEEEEEQEIENLFEKIMKENFPNLAKEIDFQEVQEAQRVPNKLVPRSTHQVVYSSWVVYSSGTLWVSSMNSAVKLEVSSHCPNPHRILQSEVLRLSFPALEPWVEWSASLLGCSSWFIHTLMGNRQPLSCPPRPPASTLPCFSALAACL